jgi:hypothetical protein
MTPRGVDHFLDYLRAREKNDTHDRSVTLRDLEVLREGRAIYTTLEHQALCAAWKIGSTNEDHIRHSFQQQGPRAKFVPIAMPYRYPLYQLKYGRMEKPGPGSSHRTGRLPLLGKEGPEKQPLMEGGG